MKKSAYKFVFVLAIMVLVGAVSSASAILVGAEIAPPQPPFPTACDQLAITVYGQWSDSCIPDELQVSVVGNHIYFHVFHCTRLDTVCLTVITDWSLTESVGPLLPGHYTVSALLSYYGEGGDEVTLPLSIAEREFDVADPRPVGDFDLDCRVDWTDFAMFVANWLDDSCAEPGWCGGADLDHSGQVGWGDFGIFAAHWLECVSVGCVPEMAWHVEPECAPETAQGQDELSTAEDLDETRFAVTVEEQYIYFEDMIKANCCPGKLELQMTVEGSQIIVLETQEMEGCYCLCDFPATATLGPLADGTYTVEVIDPYGVSVGTVQVTIGGSQ